MAVASLVQETRWSLNLSEQEANLIQSLLIVMDSHDKQDNHLIRSLCSDLNQAGILGTKQDDLYLARR